MNANKCGSTSEQFIFLLNPHWFGLGFSLAEGSLIRLRLPAELVLTSHTHHFVTLMGLLLRALRECHKPPALA